MNDYYERALGVRISRNRALEELDKHGALGDSEDFLNCCGDYEHYDAAEVLRWLGY